VQTLKRKSQEVYPDMKSPQAELFKKRIARSSLVKPLFYDTLIYATSQQHYSD
jgi:hypothetical protein